MSLRLLEALGRSTRLFLRRVEGHLCVWTVCPVVHCHRSEVLNKKPLPHSGFDLCWKPFLNMRTFCWFKRLFWTFIFSPNTWEWNFFFFFLPSLILDSSQVAPSTLPRNLSQSSSLGTFPTFYVTTGDSFAKLDSIFRVSASNISSPVIPSWQPIGRSLGFC